MSPAVCGNCGAQLSAGDQFCGNCGIRTTPATPEDPQVISPEEIGPELNQGNRQGAVEGRDRGALWLVGGAAAAVAVLLLAGAAFGFGPGAGFGSMFGSSEPPANGAAEVEEPPSASPEPPTPTTPETMPEEPQEESTQETTEFTSGGTTAEPEGGEMTAAPPAPEEDLTEAVRDYYEAVDRGDWTYTYDNLDAQTQALFEPDEWEQKNQYYSSNFPSNMTNLEVEVLDMASSGTSGGAIAEVAVYREFDGEESPVRETAFVYEEGEDGGEWKHRFIGEELELFRPDLTYEEFVEEQE